ncbi:FtsK/SpoIIIE domain-containing protein [Oryzobacter telluris]|uniref:FtsK/SpoIIIE domain-containing protein n=1 Tax=Oryzobacter telluris TaxID=3149179 RepID=UPI00370DA52A
MELTLTVHVPRRRPHPVDVVVRWEGRHTADALGRALEAHLGVPVRSLSARGRPVPPDDAVGSGLLRHGAAVTVHDVVRDQEVSAPLGPTSVLELAVVGGPDAGRSRPLAPPGFLVGRSVAGGLSLADDALSRAHARIAVDASGVVVADEGSTNGVLVDGTRVTQPHLVDSGSTLVMGASTLRLRRVTGAGLPVEEDPGGRLLVRPATTSAVLLDDLVVEAPPPLPDRHRPRVPWVAALLPVPIALVLAWFLGPHLLAFALLGPVLLLGTALGDRWGSGRAHRRAVADRATAWAEARAVADRLVAEDAARLDRAHPDLHAVLRTVEEHRPGLWSRSDLQVRIGFADVSTRVVWRDGPSTERPRAHHAPVVLDLGVTREVTAVGATGLVSSFLASLVGQLCVGLPPSALEVAVASDAPEWDWVRLVPHVVAVPGSRPGLRGEEPAVSGRRSSDADPGPPARVLVVPAVDGATPDRVAAARDRGWVVLAGTPDAPAGTELGQERAVVELGDGTILTTASGTTPLVADHVGSWWTDRVSRALAPLREDHPEDAAGLRSSVSLTELFGSDTLTPASVMARWAGAGGRLRAPIGFGRNGVHTIDLDRDGPHILVGGTTGAGKSEFLRTLVASLAASVPPEDLALVLVDFKGGAAFGACTDLPHVAGVLTDLDEHLVARALASLGAELRRRERLFATVGASDLNAYRQSARQPERVPRLVVVVDELKALVQEVPRFVDGLVRLAAQGRSLGVHLVLATQRPSGALSSEVQANVNLRIAFRVRDRADSVDVLDDPAAAALDPSAPGRAIARGGDGCLTHFQSALITTPPEVRAPHLCVHQPGDSCPTCAPAHPDGRGSTAGPRRDDAVHQWVSVIREAAAEAGQDRARRPWPAPLPSSVEPAGADAEGGVLVGLVDEPDLQRTSRWSWSPQDGTWLVSGGPRSGRSTAARAVVLSAASRLGVEGLHLHVVDPTGALADLRALPQTGTTVAAGDDRGLRALVDHLCGLVSARRHQTSDPTSPDGAAGRPREPVVLVVVDGWEQIVEARPEQWADPTLDALVTVLRDGPAVGVVGVVTGGRALLHPTWGGLGGQVLVLGRVDVLDAALAGLRAEDLPSSPPSGRGVRVRDRREVQVAAATAATTDLVRRTSAGLPRAEPARPPWRHVPLPDCATREAVVRSPNDRLGVGLSRTDTAVAEWTWRPPVHGRRMLVAGPPRSGRSTTLAAIADAARLAGRPVALVTRSGVRSGRPSPDPLFWVVPPDDPGPLVMARRAHPDLVVLVDDADRTDDTAVAPVLREVAELVDRDDGLLVVATTTSSLAVRFRGLDVETARQGFGILLWPRPADGDVLGQGRLEALPRVPGRGVVVGDGAAVELQVYRPAASGVAVDLRSEGVDALGRERHEGRPESQREEAPAEEP